MTLGLLTISPTTYLQSINEHVRALWPQLGYVAKYLKKEKHQRNVDPGREVLFELGGCLLLFNDFYFAYSLKGV